MTSIIDLSFPVHGTEVWADQNHRLLAALTQKVKEVHQLENFAVNTIMGIPNPDKKGVIKLTPESRLVLRLSVEAIQYVHPLVGQTLNLGGYSIQLGNPTLETLKPTDTLKARVVTIKGYTEPAPFLEAADRQLQALGIQASVGIPANKNGEPKRLTLKITKDLKGEKKSFTIVGFSVVVSHLTPDDSLKLQAHGLGGKRRLGAGVFFDPSFFEVGRGERHARTSVSQKS